MAKKDTSIYDHMELNPFALGKSEMMTKYQIFTAKVFWHHPGVIIHEEDNESRGLTLDEIDLIIKYVVLFIDPQSPHYAEKNFDLRVSKCARALNIEKNTPVGNEVFGNGLAYEKIVYHFFVRVNDHLYETWFSMKMNQHEMAKYLRGPLVSLGQNNNVAQEVNARRQLALTMQEMMYELLELEMQLFPDERIQKIIADRSNDDGLGGAAEQYAEEPKYNQR